MPARRVEEEVVNEGVPPQGPQDDQVLVDAPAMTNDEIRSSFLTLAQAMTAQVEGLCEDEPTGFLGSKVGEDPQNFLDEVYKIVNSMGVTSIKKRELAAYQLKDVAQILFTQWKSNRPIRARSIDWELFKKAFLGRFFPREKKVVKMEEFINLRQDNMSVQEYSLKFTQLSKYAPSLGSNPRDEMSRFVTGISNLVEEECHTAMLHDDMNISRLMVYAQSIEEFKLKRNNRELKRSRPDEQGQPRHYGKCLVGTSGCYGCGKSDHQMRNFPTLTTKGREAKQASLNGPDLDAPKRNHFYALQANKDKGANPDKGTGK
ncbi:uncharacterized protein LOC125806778 [Solanum verrucosum]|uniref:uncharacterized protein LOC125806778 n=1 Tax=Solanum verrucosum TaxID=315347 RepID=UPI0020D1CD02|nr:uncharacterized protein LOC125806778 [Solanum verrucosum]